MLARSLRATILEVDQEPSGPMSVVSKRIIVDLISTKEEVYTQCNNRVVETCPRCSIYGIFTYIR